jgi:hypothetical protein
LACRCRSCIRALQRRSSIRRRPVPDYRRPARSAAAQDDSALNALLATQIPASERVAGCGRRDRARDDAGRRRDAGARPDARRHSYGPPSDGCSTISRPCARKPFRAKRRDARRQFTRTRSLVFPAANRRNARSDSCRSSTKYGPALVQRLDEQLPIDLEALARRRSRGGGPVRVVGHQTAATNGPAAGNQGYGPSGEGAGSA